MVFEPYVIAGYFGYVLAIATIGYFKFQSKAADGIQAKDVIEAVEEAKEAFDVFVNVIDTVIKDENVNAEDTVKFIENAIDSIKKAG